MVIEGGLTDMVTIDQLDNPVLKPTPFGSITLTHRAWGFTIRAWNTPPMVSYSVLGVLENGAFVVYPGTEEYASFSLDDFLALSTDPATGPHVIATVDAVKAAHQRIVGTDAPLPLTTHAAGASAPRLERDHGSTDTKARPRAAVRPAGRKRR